MLRLMALLLFVQSPVLAAPPPNMVRLFRADYDGAQVEYRIPVERAQRLPRWSPGEGTPPPLTVQQVVRISTEWMKARKPRFDTYLPWQIELTRVTYINGGVLWHYVVHSDAVAGTRRIPGFGMHAVILMDGSVVEPIDLD